MAGVVDLMAKEFIVYHGTLSTYKNSIINNGFIANFPKKGDERWLQDNHWLGHGIYFYEDENLAIRWAELKAKAKTKKFGKLIDPVVMSATILVDDESKICNLDNRFELNNLNRFLIELEKDLFNKKLLDFTIGIKSNEVDKDKYEELKLMRMRCFGIDCYKKHNKLAVIMYTFKEDLVFCGEKSRIVLPINEKQICVENNVFIKDSRLCYPKEEYI